MVMLDVVELRAQLVRLHAERRGEMLADTSDLPHAPKPVDDVRRVAQPADRLDDLRREVRARVAPDGDVLERARIDPGLLHAPRGRERREAGDVLDTTEPLLLRGGDELSVDDERGRSVTVKGVQTQNCGHECDDVIRVVRRRCACATGGGERAASLCGLGRSAGALR